MRAGLIDVTGADSCVSDDTADLAAAVTHSAGPVALGDSYTYTSTVTNNGPAAATAGAVRTIVPGATV